MRLFHRFPASVFMVGLFVFWLWYALTGLLSAASPERIPSNAKSPIQAGAMGTPSVK